MIPLVWAHKVRWKHRSEIFNSQEAAETWASRHPGSTTTRWNGARWEPVPARRQADAVLYVTRPR